MPALLAFVSRRVVRHALVWLLAALLPVQGMAAALLATLGPLHTHRTVVGAAGTAPAFDAALVLVDFRRGIKPSAAAATHVALPFGHLHAAAAPERHRHTRSDASVVVAAGGDLASAATADADDGAVSPALACWVALPSRATEVAAPAPAPCRGPEPAASWRSHAPAPPEHPPRRA